MVATPYQAGLSLFLYDHREAPIKRVVGQYSMVCKEDKFLCLVSLPWLLGVESTLGVSLRLVLWNAQVRIVRWGLMGPVTRHLSERAASPCRCW